MPAAVARETVETVLAALADGSTREDVATRLSLPYWTVVRIAQGRIKGKSTWPADSAEAWEPTCMDAEDWAAWQTMNRSLGKENQAPRPCTDCLAGYAAEMRAVGRCNGQPAGDHREEDTVDDRLAAIVVPDDVPGPPGTTRPMRIAWYLCHDRGLPWADAARVLGTSSWNVSQAVERYMLKAGLKGDPPGRLPAEERQRRAMVGKGLDPDHRRRAPKGATQMPPAAEVAPVSERLVLAPDGHPWAADPEPIALVNQGPTLVNGRADHAKTIPGAIPGGTYVEPMSDAGPINIGARTGGGGRDTHGDDFLSRLEHELDRLARTDAQLVEEARRIVEQRTDVARRIEEVRTAGAVFRRVMGA